MATSLLTQGLYKGFSSFEFQRNKTFTLQDIELVNMDILNQIFTLRGTRVMMPTYGTLIPQLTFEPLDDTTISSVENELITVFSSDPRVQLINMQSIPNFDQNSLVVTSVLLYKELQVTQPFVLNLTFET